MSFLVRFFTALFLLLVFHSLLDYQLQLNPVADMKDPLFKSSARKKYGPWWWSMSAHALINGGGVYFVTGMLWLAVAETVVHFALDTWKCHKIITTNADQLGHVVSKVLWGVLYAIW